MLTRLKLGNFKSWRELDIELAPITLLYGTNSSGKTSILQALLLLKQTAESFDRSSINFGGTERTYTDLGSYVDLIYGHDDKKELSIEITWKPDSTDYRLSEPLRNSVGEIEIFGFDHVRRGQIWRFLKRDSLVSTTSLSAIGEESTLLTVNLGEDGSGYFSSAPTWVSVSPPEQVFFQYDTLYDDLIDRLKYLGPLRSFPRRTYQWTGVAPQIIDQRGENAIQVLIASLRKKESEPAASGETLLSTIEFWLIRLGLAHSFRIEAIDKAERFYETKVGVSLGAASVSDSLSDVGFGISQVLPVITSMFFVPEGSIVLIEQPELHLHPSAQAALADLFLEVAEKRKLQLIIESHSEHLLTRFQRRIAEPHYAFATPQNVKAYFCKPGDNGSTIEEVRVNRFGQIENYPPNFFGDLSGDLDAMYDAGTQRRLEELEQGE